MQVELIHPPHPQATDDRLDPPLGLMYVASSLQEAGHSVRINDLSGQKTWAIGEADIYGITVYIPTLSIARQIAVQCRQRNPEAKIIVGGAHPTAMPESIDFADAIVLGEGELAMLDAVADYPSLKPLYRRPLERDLDLYPNPAYWLVDLGSYSRTVGGEPSFPTLATRGCPYRCAFCGLAEHHKVVKCRSPELVVEELSWLVWQYGVRKFNFQDDSFTVGRKRLYRLLDLLEPLEIGFRCHGRVGLDRADDYERLKSAGCELISWGIESGSQEMLNRMNKQTTVEANALAIRKAKEVGLTTRAFFVIGFPGETKETLAQTKRFIEEVQPDQYFVSNFVPYPGTDVWDHPKKYGVRWISNNLDDYYQIDWSGHGGGTISTDWLSREEFLTLEAEFRCWLKSIPRRGPLLDYERSLENSVLHTG